jgi:CBS domain-containing protein
MEDSVRSWMTAKVQTVTPATHVEDLIDKFASERLSSAPVVDHDAVVGVVSRADLVRAISVEHNLADWMLDTLSGEDEAAEARSSQLFEFMARRLEGKRVEQVMNVVPITIGADSDMGEAARLLVEHRIHHAPVVEGTRLVGVVSTFDIARWVAAGGRG